MGASTAVAEWHPGILFRQMNDEDGRLDWSRARFFPNMPWDWAHSEVATQIIGKSAHMPAAKAEAGRETPQSAVTEESLPPAKAKAKRAEAICVLFRRAVSRPKGQGLSVPMFE